MSAPAGRVLIEGAVSDLVAAGIRLSVRNPCRSADQLPYALQLAEFNGEENSFLIAAEVAAIRWLDVVAAARLVPDTLLALLTKVGVAAIAFDSDGRTTTSLARLLGIEAASELTAVLRGRVYVAPLLPWSPQMAEAIYRDILAERATGFDERAKFRICAERDALLAVAEAAS